MPYNKRKQKCKQSDGTPGNYVLSYTTKKGEKRKACHTSQKKMQGQIAAIEAEADESEEEVLTDSDKVAEALLREWVLEALLSEASNLSAPEMKSRPARFDTFLKKIKEKTPFTTVAGDEFQIPEEGNEVLIAALQAKDPAAYKSAFSSIVTVPPNAVSSPTKVRKTGEFGGIGSGKRLEKEDAQIAQIQEALDEISPVDVSVGRKVAKGVVAVETVVGTPKADCVLKDGNDNVVAAISLKDADVPTQMQQWGGISKFSDHPEVKEFVEDLKAVQAASENGRINMAYYRQIEDADLARAMCYGDGSGPTNDCDMIIASRAPIGIDPSGKFEATNIFYAPEVPPGEWYPTLWATHRTGRGTGLGLNNIRVGIYPRDWGSTRTNEELPARSPEGTVNEAAKSILRQKVRQLLTEDLTGSDKADIKRMIKKELEGPANRREIDKAFKKKFDTELRKALGSSFFGTPGKINKFVADEIEKAVEKHLGSTANREVVVRICKDVMVKLYRELSFSYKPLIDRMKV